MNVLGLVFSLLMILSYSFYACWEKQSTSSRLQTTYVKHLTANRTILNDYESEVYKKLPRKKNPTTETAEEEEEDQADEKTSKEEPKQPDPNRECAKLNLWPLIQEGQSIHPTLYELAAKMIRTFYFPLQVQKKPFETHFLDRFLDAAKRALQQETPFALEKIDMGDSEWQRIYYKMLKGTKDWDLSTQAGYPPLLDYIKAEATPSKICLFHAHPDIIAVLFSYPVAIRLYTEVHQKKEAPFTEELVEKTCSEMHQTIDRKLFELLKFGRPNHSEDKKTFIAKEGDVSLRKNLYLKGGGHG